MNDDIYDFALRSWICRNYEKDLMPHDISNARYETIQQGYCETCAYETVGIVYDIDKNGAGRRGGEVEIEYTDPARLIREVSEIIQELQNGD